MKILGIETSCDETAAAVVCDGCEILSNVVVSQIDIFKEYGGVIPEVAARSHLEVVLPVVDKALSDASCSWDDIDAIAVTHAPGLLGSLLIGTLTARTLAILHNKPLYAVHHLKSHVYANWLGDKVNRKDLFSTRSSQPVVTGGTSLNCSSSVANGLEEAFSVHSTPVSTSEFRNAPQDAIFDVYNPQTFHELQNAPQDTIFDIKGLEKTSFTPYETHTPTSKFRNAPQNTIFDAHKPQFPVLAMVISGGHTQILWMTGHNQFEIIGTTRDDAVGECFDKVAKILGLPYPGGPSVAKAAMGELPDGVKVQAGDPDKYHLPKPNVAELDFSFSGLKTAVLRAVQKELGLPISFPSHELKNHLTPEQVADFAASFQNVACEILIDKLKKALVAHPEARSIVFAGGVSANQALRQKALTSDFGGREVYFPEPKYSGDNGAMVAAAGYFEIISGVQPTDPYRLNIYPRISIEA